MKKVLSAVLVLVLLLSIGAAAFADNTNTTAVNHFNVVLVIDGSDSLIHTERTDPNGYRYDAVKLFLGLLTESGNNVGAIVFDDNIMLDTGIKSMENMSSKIKLANRIKSAGTGDYTNIGSAVMRAVNELEGMTDENGLPSIILLLSDGNTDPGDSMSRKQALKTADAAIEQAANDGITIHGIFLNTNGKGDSSEILKYTSVTNGTMEEVSSADDLTDAFSRFYNLINNTEFSNANEVVFDENGYAEKTFFVPSFDIEEVNVVIGLQEPLQSIEITKPDGSMLSQSEIDDMTITTSRYQLTKIPNPETGMWTAKLQGTANSTVNISMMYNFSFKAYLDVNQDSDAFQYMVPYTFTCSIVEEIESNFSHEDLETYDTALCVVNADTNETVSLPMTATSEGYEADYTFGIGSYYVYAAVGCEGFATKTNQIEVTIENQAPYPVKGAGINATVTTGASHDGIWTVDLSDYVKDPEGEEITYELDNSYGGAVQQNGSRITVNCNDINSATIHVQASDPHGASCELTINLVENKESVNSRTSNNFLIPIILLVLILAAIIAFIVWKMTRPCVLKIKVDAFAGSNRKSLPPLYYFQGKKRFSKIGKVYGARESTLCFEATKDKNICYFKSGKPFSYEGKKITKIKLCPGTEATVYFDAKNTIGLDIKTQAPSFNERKKTDVGSTH